MSTVNSYIKLDEAKCIDCGACQAACLNNHGKRSSILAGKEKGLIVVNCQHCENAPCGNACPVGAITQEANSIMIDEDKCVGCGACERACPFNAVLMIDRSEESRFPRVAHKCDLCEGIEGNKCIEFCPVNALSLVDSAQERMNKATKIANMMAKKK